MRSLSEKYKFPADCYGYSVCQNQKISKYRPRELAPEEMMEIQYQWTGLNIVSNILIFGSALMLLGKLFLVGLTGISSII